MLYLYNVVFKEVEHLFRALKHVFLSVLIESLESFDEVLFDVVWKPLDDVNHQNSVSAIAKTWAQEKVFIAGVVDDLGLCSPFNIVV